MLASLTHRDRQPELMDQPGLDEGSHRIALRGLRRVNFLCSAVPLMFRSIARLATGHDSTSPLRVLDVAALRASQPVVLVRRSRAFESGAVRALRSLLVDGSGQLRR